MRPWFAWLRFVNPIAYGFEAMLVNEFEGLDLRCESPYLVPEGPRVLPQYQSCTIPGNVQGQSSVDGERYVEQASVTAEDCDSVD